MKTNQLHHSINWNIGLYNGCVAIDNFNMQTSKYTIYVFKDISPKRIAFDKNTYMRNAKPKTITNNNKRAKVEYISNEQLMDMNHPKFNNGIFQEMRKLVFDGKIGTRYHSKGQYSSCSGSYFACLQAGSTIPTTKYQ